MLWCCVVGSIAFAAISPEAEPSRPADDAVWTALRSLKDDGQAVVVDFDDGHRHLIRGFSRPVGHYIIESTRAGSTVTVTHQMGAGGTHDCDVIYLDPRHWVVGCTVFPFVFDAASLFLHTPDGFDVGKDTSSFVITPEMCAPLWVNSRYGKGSETGAPDRLRTTMIAIAAELARWPQDGLAALRHLVANSGVPLPRTADPIRDVLNPGGTFATTRASSVTIHAAAPADFPLSFVDGEDLERWLLRVISDAR